MNTRREFNYNNLRIIKEALYVAIKAKCKENVAQFLLQHNANSVIKTEELSTPLHVAVCVPNNTEILNLLLNHGAYIDSNNYLWRTPLHVACNIENNAENVRFLLEHGANVNLVDRDGCMPLHLAGEHKNNFETVELLVKYNCDVNHPTKRWGFTPLHQASQRGNIRVVELLIKNGAHVNAKSLHLHTPLFIATFFCDNFELVKMLLKYGADVNQKYLGGDDETIFYLAMRKKRNFEVIHYLLQYGADSTCSAELAEKIDARSQRSSLDLETMNNLMREIIKLNSLNLINKEQFKSWKLVQLYDSEEMLKFQKECETEANKLKNKLICSDRVITLADILTKNVRKVANYVSLVDVKKRLGKVNYNYQYPIFVEILKKRISDAKKLSVVLTEGYQALKFSLINDKELPDTFIYLTLKCLSDKDIENLNEAFRI